MGSLGQLFTVLCSPGDSGDCTFPYHTSLHMVIIKTDKYKEDKTSHNLFSKDANKLEYFLLASPHAIIYR